jgi:hypothetical protein
MNPWLNDLEFSSDHFQFYYVLFSNNNEHVLLYVDQLTLNAIKSWSLCTESCNYVQEYSSVLCTWTQRLFSLGRGV